MWYWYKLCEVIADMGVGVIEWRILIMLLALFKRVFSSTYFTYEETVSKIANKLPINVCLKSSGKSERSFYEEIVIEAHNKKLLTLYKLNYPGTKKIALLPEGVKIGSPVEEYYTRKSELHKFLND